MKRFIHDGNTGKVTEETLTADEQKVVNDQNAADIKDQWILNRRLSYPSTGEFADAMYWNSKGDSSKLTAYYAACEKVKTDNPKP